MHTTDNKACIGGILSETRSEHRGQGVVTLWGDWLEERAWADLRRRGCRSH